MGNLSFSYKEMAAIISLARIMSIADGKADKNESIMIANEALRFGISSDDLKSLLQQANDMNTIEIVSIIAVMTDAQKRYVTAFLGTLMAIDGDIDDNEMKLWSFVSMACKLPEMNIREAIEIMKNL